MVAWGRPQIRCNMLGARRLDPRHTVSPRQRGSRHLLHRAQAAALPVLIDEQHRTRFLLQEFDKL